MSLGRRLAGVAVRDNTPINNREPAGGQHLEVGLQREVRRGSLLYNLLHRRWPKK